MVLIRPLTAGDSRDEYVDLRFRAFGPGSPERVWVDAEAAIAGGRCLAAVDDGHLVGAAMYFDLRQWWRGSAVPMAGVAGVKIAPEYRGQGVGGALMTALTQLMAERGYPLSALYAATSPIYRKLGWERAGTTSMASVPSRSLLSLSDVDAGLDVGVGVGVDVGAGPDRRVGAGAGSGSGGIPALRRPGPDDAAEVIAVLGRVHELARDCGPVTFDQETVRRWLTAGRWAGSDHYAYLAEDGFLAYAWNEDHHELAVDKLVAVSPAATRALWSVVASHGSIARTVRVQVAPADPLWWLLREQDMSPAGGYWWMLRLLDAPAAIAARGFPAVELEVPLEIADDQVSANTGSWILTVRSGAGALVPAASKEAAGRGEAVGRGEAGSPLRLGARGLAALYAGTPVPTLRATGLAEGGSAESDAALDSAFAATAFMLDAF